MKRNILCVILVIIMLICSGCLPNYVNITGFYAPHRILYVDMPYADNLHTGQFDKVEKLEEDSYGRCYYSYRTPSNSVQYAEIEIHVICQKETEKELYYYPDYCYMARDSEGDAFSKEEIAHLKERNDWEKPLDEERMRQIPNNYPDWIIRNWDLEPILRDYLKLEEKDFVILHYMEINNRNQQMFFCQVTKNMNQEESITQDYILIYQESNSQPIVAIEEIEHTLECQDAMHNFRITWFEPEQ